MRLFEYVLDRRARGFVQRRLVAAFEFEGAALEFGGDTRCQAAPAPAPVPAEAASKDPAPLLLHAEELAAEAGVADA